MKRNWRQDQRSHDRKKSTERSNLSQSRDLKSRPPTNFQTPHAEPSKRQKVSNHRRKYRQASADRHAKDMQMPSTSCAESQQKNNELDIPGFYYDKEKKRYFKIAPNHCPNAVTLDTIKKKEAEKKRQEDVKMLQEKDTNERNPRKNKTSKHNLTSLIFSYSIGQLNSEKLCNNILESHVTNLKPINSQHLTGSLSSIDGYNRLEHSQMMLVNKDHDDLLCLWSLKETWVQRLQLVKLSETERMSDKRPISVTGEPHGKVIIQSLNKVTDICWAPLANSSQEDHVLYTTICHTGYLNSLAMIRSLSSEQEQEPTFIDYNLGKRATWACAWNSHKQQFSVGSEKCALILNVERRTMWEFSTCNSDPLSQVFSKQSGNCLHTGTRNGFVLTHDLRSRSTRPVCSLQHKSSVCSVNLLQNDGSILASDFTGRICLWDLRNKQAVVEYVGNYNQYTKIPVHVDERERILYTVGEDGYTRFWCLRLGSLLHTIPPPCPTSRETIPCVQYSMRWGDKMGNSGLIMGLEDKLHYYGSLPVT